MERLPNEVLMLILDLLPSRDLLGTAARVSRRWAALVARRALAVCTSSDLQRLHCGIVTVEVSARLDSLRAFLSALSAECPHLRNLTVHAANPLSGDDLDALGRLPFLQHLDVFVQARILDKRALPTLLRLSSLVVNETVSPALLRALARGRLRALHMYGRALYYPPRGLIAVLRARRPHLRELTLRCTELQDNAYAVIGECSNLTSLQLYSCWLMTINGAISAIQPKSLKHLHLTGARMVRSNALFVVIEHLPLAIEELVLSATWFTDIHVAPLVTRLPALKVLELWRCRLSLDSILMLSANLVKLESLDTDIPLAESSIETITGHPSLTSLRCCLAERESGLRGGAGGAGGRPLLVRAADARYEKRFLRAGGEGYRGSLFYFNTRHRPLEPLPRSAHPAFDDDDEDF